MRAEADISEMGGKRLTNHERLGQLANQTGLYQEGVGPLKRQELKPSVSDRGWKEELQQRTYLEIEVFTEH